MAAASKAARLKDLIALGHKHKLKRIVVDGIELEFEPHAHDSATPGVIGEHWDETPKELTPEQREQLFYAASG